MNDPHPLGAAALSEDDLDTLEKMRRLATPGWHANPVNPQSVTSSQSHPIWTLSDDFHRQCMHGTGQDREYLLALYNAAPSLIALARRPTAPSQEGEAFRWFVEAKFHKGGGCSGCVDSLEKAEDTLKHLQAAAHVESVSITPLYTHPAKPVDGEVAAGAEETAKRLVEHAQYYEFEHERLAMNCRKGAATIRRLLLAAALPLEGKGLGADLSQSDRHGGSLTTDQSGEA